MKCVVLVRNEDEHAKVMAHYWHKARYHSSYAIRINGTWAAQARLGFYNEEHPHLERICYKEWLRRVK